MIDQEFKTHVTDLLSSISRDNVRHLVIISGSHSWCQHYLEVVFESCGNTQSILVSSNGKLTQQTTTTTDENKVNIYLGQEFKLAIYDMYSGFNPDALGALSGTVMGGGILVLLTPQLDHWHEFDDPYRDKLLYWPHSRENIGNRFIKRFVDLLFVTPEITFIDQKQGLRAGKYGNISGTDHPGQDSLAFEECRTVDQCNAVSAIIHVATGHRNRPAVLVSNRGRGKSSALGIGAARLLQSRTHHIIITAPALSSTQSCFQIARELLPDFTEIKSSLTDTNRKFEFVSPDELIRSRPQCDILLVDEAAAIPTPILLDLLRNYSRIVFSTTVHGYEGTGRGFLLRFRQILDEVSPGWKMINLEKPVRWNSGDPVEAFIFKALLLDAALAPPDNLASSTNSDIQVDKYHQDELLNNEEVLSQLFALLVYAHYQTRPKDLRFILDSLEIEIYALNYKGNIIATAIIQNEGNLEGNLREEVYKNRRRLRGHILPQSLESQLGISNSGKLRYKRVIRIAVHPVMQKKGLGSYLVSKILDSAAEQHIDIVGAVFGATPELVNFWRRLEFIPVHVGIKRNASSGTNSVCVIRPISEKGRRVTARAGKKFGREFPFKLSTVYQRIPHDLIPVLLSGIATFQSLRITSDDWKDLKSFSETDRELDVNLIALQKLYIQLNARLDFNYLFTEQEIFLIVTKVLQYHSWHKIAGKAGVEGKKHAIKLIKSATRRVLLDSTVLNHLDIEGEKSE